MAKVYRVEVFRDVRRDGVYVHEAEGVPVSVDGESMVRLNFGTIVPASGWHGCKSAALRAAADEVEQMAQTLAAQAVGMIERAAKESTKEG